MIYGNYPDKSWTCAHCQTVNPSKFGYVRQWCRWCLRRPDRV